MVKVSNQSISAVQVVQEVNKVMFTGSEEEDCYGIVIDAGSSGSRLHIFKWTDPSTFDALKHEAEQLKSVPKIEQSKDWTFKVSPGLSSYEHKTHKAFSHHIHPLLKEAEKIIPANKFRDTPVFIQATAGMRLIPEKKRNAILHDICSNIQKSTKFKMVDCASQVQIIDGETEGIYGWIGLNYLLGNFDNYSMYSKEHFTMGFMDMGGASAQIAFVPSDKEGISHYKSDISTVYLRSMNGDIQEWDVFVSTWLGFGANQARTRYLAQLVNALPENTNSYDDDDFTTRVISDPCMPRGSKTKFKFKDTKFDVIGLGDFEQCSKSIYPLLLKNIPCAEEHCLFNGVHTPGIDYTKDKFVGISEFWYTPNDVFNLGGEYSFEKFSANVKEFCNTDWHTIEQKSDNGDYNGIPEDFLKEACFKSNWIINVLHEGFEFPYENHKSTGSKDSSENYPMFQSLDKVMDVDLSWTLGRILLYASGMIGIPQDGQTVGIEPSIRSAKAQGSLFNAGFIGGSTSTIHPSGRLTQVLLIFILLGILSYLIKMKKFSNMSSRLQQFQQAGSRLRYRMAEFKSRLQNMSAFDSMPDLEAGEGSANRLRSLRDPLSLLKSKSMFNLNTQKHKSDSVKSATHFDEGRPVSDGLQSSQSSANMRPSFSMADFSKFQNDDSIA